MRGDEGQEAKTSQIGMKRMHGRIHVKLWENSLARLYFTPIMREVS